MANDRLDHLWNKNCALDPNYIAGLLYSPEVTNFIKRTLKAKFNTRFEDEDIHSSISQIIYNEMSPESVKPAKKANTKTPSKKVKGKEDPAPLGGL